ncbi:hypothetical protein HDU97_006911 [Phlyctochytrium planicorne]|nr:hypothetical protein HDU97_006911 [Phlyctochytrium planicorne]
MLKLCTFIALLPSLVHGATMKDWLSQYATKPYSDQHTAKPLTFAQASKIVSAKTYTNGTLFVASDDVYQTAGSTTGGVAFIKNVVIDYTAKDSKPGDPDAGKFHFDYFADDENKIAILWDDYAPGRPLTDSQVWGVDRKIFVTTGNEVTSNSCYLTHAVFCDDGLIQVTNCLLNPSPKFTDALANQKARLSLTFNNWIKYVEQANMLDTLNNLPFNGFTLLAPSDDYATPAAITALGNRSTTEMAKIIAYNAVLTPYTSNNYPPESDTALSGQRRTLGPDTLAGTAADILFFGGIIRGVNQIAVPKGDFSGSQITGLPAASSAGGPDASATASVSATATEAGKKGNGAVKRVGGGLGVFVGLLGLVAWV